MRSTKSEAFAMKWILAISPIMKRKSERERRREGKRERDEPINEFKCRKWERKKPNGEKEKHSLQNLNRRDTELCCAIIIIIFISLSRSIIIIFFLDIISLPSLEVFFSMQKKQHFVVYLMSKWIYTLFPVGWSFK